MAVDVSGKDSLTLGDGKTLPSEELMMIGTTDTTTITSSRRFVCCLLASPTTTTSSRSDCLPKILARTMSLIVMKHSYILSLFGFCLGRLVVFQVRCCWGSIVFRAF